MWPPPQGCKQRGLTQHLARKCSRQTMTASAVSVSRLASDMTTATAILWA